MTTPKWVNFFRDKSKYFDMASQSLETLWHARGGGKIDLGLAGISLFGKVVNTVYPVEGAWSKLRNLGLKYQYTSVSELICRELLKEGNGTLIFEGDEQKAYVWTNPDRKAEVGVLVGKGSVDLFLSDTGRDRLAKELVNVWGKGNEIFLTKTPDREIILSPMNPPGPYVGPYEPEYYAERLKKISGARTVLIRGPTGVGKSVLARHISRSLGKGDSKTLKISSSILDSCGENEIVGLVKYLQPTVLLLDDVNLKNSEKTEMFLSLLETIRDPDCLIIATMMTLPTDVEKSPEKGSWHFPGMRPGRIDYIITLYLPNEDCRKRILDLYLQNTNLKIEPEIMKELIKETDGLSGAYLGAVVDRLSAFGLDEWKEEVAHIFYAAPPANLGKKEEEKESNEKEISPESDDTPVSTSTEKIDLNKITK